MLQALVSQTSDLKVPSGKSSAIDSQENLLDLDSMLEQSDFDTELMASLSNDSSEQEKSNPSIQTLLLAPLSINHLLDQGALPVSDVDTTLSSPKAPAVEQARLTSSGLPAEFSQNVRVPQLTEAGALPQYPVAEKLQLSPLQAPAGNLADAPKPASHELTSQLVNLDEFVNQKKIPTKKIVSAADTYELGKTPNFKFSSDNGLTSTQVVNELGAVSEGSQGPVMNSQHFILSSQVDSGESSATKVGASAPVKTFDMSHIKSENSEQIINQISDYIVQSKVAKEPTVNLRINHAELGTIDITVNRIVNTPDAVAVNISTHSTEGKSFFQANSKDLMAHLSSSGVTLTDLKIDSPTLSAKNDFDFAGQSGKGHSQDRQFGSEQNQKRHESQRRQDLWDLLNDKDAA
jgi:hypothetical protein